MSDVLWLIVFVAVICALASIVAGTYGVMLTAGLCIGYIIARLLEDQT